MNPTPRPLGRPVRTGHHTRDGRRAADHGGPELHPRPDSPHDPQNADAAGAPRRGGRRLATLTAAVALVSCAPPGDDAKSMLAATPPTDAGPAARDDDPVPATPSTVPRVGGVPDLAWFPDADSTGVPEGTVLTPSEPLKITEDGTVIDGLDVRGQITIRADDVVVRNTRVETNGDLYGISLDPDYENLLIEDVDIVRTDSRCSVGIVHGNFTARRVDVSGCEDGLRVGDDTVVLDSYIHDLRESEGAHNDVAQSLGGTNITFIGNRMEGLHREQTSAVLFHSHFFPLDSVRLENNLFSGGTYTVAIKPKGDNPRPTDVVVRNNVWVRDSYKFGSHRFDADGLVVEGNLFEDGTAYEYDTLKE
ncbi:MAG: hypothetical protein S0880_35895 [Actinomycetota bacterium]|nr:hypothetical protein [Actinomycetota bacterium]